MLLLWLLLLRLLRLRLVSGAVSMRRVVVVVVRRLARSGGAARGLEVVAKRGDGDLTASWFLHLGSVAMSFLVVFFLAKTRRRTMRLLAF